MDRFDQPGILVPGLAISVGANDRMRIFLSRAMSRICEVLRSLRTSVTATTTLLALQVHQVTFIFVYRQTFKMQISQLSNEDRLAVEEAFAKAVIAIYRADPDHYDDHERTVIQMMKDLMVGWIILSVWISFIGLMAFWSAYVMSKGTLLQRKTRKINDLRNENCNLRDELENVKRGRAYYRDRSETFERKVERLLAVIGFDPDERPDHIIQEAPEREQQTAPLKVTA